jgi:ubiquinone biosynthesis protein
MRKGKITVTLEHRGLDHIISEVNQASNRLAIAMVAAAIIIGSSLIISAKVGTLLFGYPVLGLIGFALAGVLCLGLLIFIIRSGIF